MKGFLVFFSLSEAPKVVRGPGSMAKAYEKLTQGIRRVKCTGRTSKRH